jgi:hypothetical protein
MPADTDRQTDRHHSEYSANHSPSWLAGLLACLAWLSNFKIRQMNKIFHHKLLDTPCPHAAPPKRVWGEERPITSSIYMISMNLFVLNMTSAVQCSAVQCRRGMKVAGQGLMILADGAAAAARSTTGILVV